MVKISSITLMLIGITITTTLTILSINGIATNMVAATTSSNQTQNSESLRIAAGGEMVLVH